MLFVFCFCQTDFKFDMGIVLQNQVLADISSYLQWQWYNRCLMEFITMRNDAEFPTIHGINLTILHYESWENIDYFKS